MKKKFTFSLLLGLVIFYTFTNNSDNVSNTKTWNNCGGCHTSSSTTTVDSIILLHPTTGAVMTGYYPDSNYKIRMVASNTSGTGTYPNFGFQLRAINPSTSGIVGTFQTPYPTNTSVTSNFLTQSAALSPTSGKYIVEATWKAPTGVTSVALQSVVNAVNGNTNQTGDAFSSSPLSNTYNVFGIISALNCANRRLIGTLTSGSAASGVSIRVPYTGGNGGTHTGQVVTSTGVTGLTATLTAGSFVSGNDSLTYTITGTPSASGTASFALNIGTKSCTATISVAAPVGTITSLGCANGKLYDTLINGQVATGVYFKVPYTGGNTGTHSGQVVSSTGITGLTATLAAGNFVNGADSVLYTVSGTPSGAGTASFALNIGGQSCTYDATVIPLPGTITALTCSGGKLTGTLVNGTAASGVSFKIPYTGGNGGVHSGQVVSSTGVTGLTATLSSGSFVSGADSVMYTVSGTPAATGTATFALSIGGKNCNYSVNVQPPVGTVTTLDCSTGTSTGTLALGVAASGVTFTIPYTGGNAGTYTVDTVNSTGVAGLKAILPSGIFASGSGSITYTVSGTAATSGTANFTINRGGQSCVFSMTVSAGTITNIYCGSGSTTGTLIAGATATGVSFTIPYAGGNGANHGGQTVQSTNVTGLTAILAADSFVTGSGNLIYNVSGTPSAIGNANFAINIGGKTCTYTIVVNPGAIASLNCGGGATTGTLVAASPASGVSFKIPYSGGNGGFYDSLSINSTGVTGLTAKLGKGNFVLGSDTLTFFVTGTPNTFGSADFFINIGSKSCLYSISVMPAVGTVTALNCGNGVTTGILYAVTPANSVSFNIPYTGGNNGTYNTDTVYSTGITGLKAVLTGGLLNMGNGNLTYNVIGTPSGAGTASFVLNVGGKSCTYNVNVRLQLGTITTLDCAGGVSGGTLKGEVAASGVWFKIPYTGGNGGTYNNITSTSTGVTGLTATASADTLATGNDTFLFTVTGTPNQGGVATFTISFDGKSCTYAMNVDLPNARVSSLNCANGITTGSLVRTQAASGVTFTVPYTGSNIGVYNGQTINSSGVTGLTATLIGDTIVMGNGMLEFAVSGTPTTVGNATFAINFGGRNCSYPIPVIHPAATVNSLVCGGIKLNYSEPFMAQIPLAGVSLDIPYTGGNGGSYGAISVNSTGVTGLTAAANAGLVATGDDTLRLTVTGTPSTSGNANFNITLGGKTCNYIIPINPLLVGTINSLSCDEGKLTGALVEGVAANGVSFTIPYDGGNRGYHFGQTATSTGITGLTATLNSGQFAIGFGLLSYSITGVPSGEGTANFALNIGGKMCTYSVAVRSSTARIMNLDCFKGSLNSDILMGTLPQGIYFTIPYQGGNGGAYDSLRFLSENITGLRADLPRGVINFGEGNLKFNLSGTTTNYGLARFTIAVGGQTCAYPVTVYKNASSIQTGNENFEFYHYNRTIVIRNHRTDMDFVITDLSGKIAKQGIVRRSDNKIEIGSTMSKGIYLVELRNEAERHSIKIMLE